MISPHPDTAQTGAVQPLAPRGLARTAVKVICAGAVVAAAHAIMYLMTTGAGRTAIEWTHPHLSARNVATVTHVAVIAGAVAAVICTLLFLWMPARAAAAAADRGKDSGSPTSFGPKIHT